MRKAVLVLALAASTAIGLASAADARDGCGRGFFRGPAGRCRPMRGEMVVAGPGVYRVGIFYPNRGYWDGRRFWRHRERWHGGWRYR